MKAMCLVFPALTGLLFTAPTLAQRRDKPPEIVFDIGKLYQSNSLHVEFKIPRQFRYQDQKLPQNFAAVFSADGHNLQIELGRVLAPQLEDARESLIGDLQREQPSASHEIKRGFQVGGMNAMTITLAGLRGSPNRDTMIFNMVDVPVQGLVRLVIIGESKERELLQRISNYILPTFRLSGDEGDDLLFEKRVVDVEYGLSYRVPKGTVGNPTEQPGVVFEGTGAGGMFVRLDAPAEATGDLAALLAQWAQGAPAAVKPAEIATRAAEAKAAIALYAPYGGRPERALLAFRPSPERTFRVEVAAKELPFLHAERIASVLDWIDIPAMEKRVAGWMPKVEAALKSGDEQELRKFARRVADAYYLRASLDIAKKILRDGPERAQVYALDCIEKGGTTPGDFEEVKRTLGSSKFKDRTKMRERAAETMGALVNLDSTNYLMRLARSDPDDMVAKAAIVALGRHRANRKNTIPFLIREWDSALKDMKSRTDAKRLRASRLGVSYRDALRMLTGQDLKDPKEARDWERDNKKILNAETLAK
ncbi:MAG: hypothetical protein JXQ29_15820 [Planctomycetes bacterium]|nr:hypothetical protein [Planctomycetota bacterium]